MLYKQANQQPISHLPHTTCQSASNYIGELRAHQHTSTPGRAIDCTGWLSLTYHDISSDHLSQGFKIPPRALGTIPESCRPVQGQEQVAKKTLVHAMNVATEFNLWSHDVSRSLLAPHT